MSVRNWQNKERQTNHNTQPPRVSRAASCEQIFPMKITPDKVYRAPSCEQISKPFLRMIAESKFVGKSQNSDLYTGKESAKGMLKFRKTNDSTYTKNTHEKYIPLPLYEPKYSGSAYNEPNKAPPVYQEIKKKVEKDKSSRPATVRVTQSKKTTDLAACFQELSSKKNEPSTSNEKIKHSSHKVVIYFGDSVSRKVNNDKTKDDIYAKTLLEETGNLGISKVQKTSATAELISQISIESEPIYSEITYNDPNITEQMAVADLESIVESKVSMDDINGNANVIATELEDGVINVEFKDNFECARRWVDIISGSATHEDYGPEAADKSLDWSFVQGWRKRYGCKLSYFTI